MHHHNPDRPDHVSENELDERRLQKIYAEAAALLCDRWRARDVVPALVMEIHRLRRRTEEIRAQLPGADAVEPEPPKAD